MVHAVDYGYDFYAAQTLRTDDGRVIMIAWMQAWENSSMRRGVCLNEWTGMMTLPRELSVKGGRLIQTPVRELMGYRSKEVYRREFVLCGEMVIPEISGRCLELNVKVSVPDGGRCGRFELRLAENETYRPVFACEMAAGVLTFDRSRSGYENDALAVRRLQLSPDMREISLRVILDRYSAEIFVNGGEQVFTSVLETPQEAQGISFYSEEEVICSVEKYDLLIP